MTNWQAIYGAKGNPLENLIGKIVKSVYVDDGEHAMVFVTDDEYIAYEAIGDCCSESWFSDIYNLHNLLGAEVTGAEAIPMPDYPADDRGRQESDAVYGYKLTTLQGYTEIVFRNSSNGWYGGWLENFDKDFDNPIQAQGYRRITENDWRA